MKTLKEKQDHIKEKVIHLQNNEKQPEWKMK